MSTLKELDKVQAFKELTDAQLESLQKYCVKEEFNRGDCLFKEADAADHL